MRKFNREYNFIGESYYFKINKELLSRYELDDIEKFIIKNEMEDVETIKVRLQEKFDINNVNSYFIIWDKLHKLYTEDVIIWHKKNPFEDMYEYKGNKFNFKIDVSLNTDHKLYQTGVFSALMKNYYSYEEDINKISEKPITNIIFLAISSDTKILGLMTLLLGSKKNSYIIGNISLNNNITNEILNNALVWVGSRLCLIFGQICKTFEFRINEKDVNKYEIKRLCDCGFEITRENNLGKNIFLLKKDI